MPTRPEQLNNKQHIKIVQTNLNNLEPAGYQLAEYCKHDKIALILLQEPLVRGERLKVLKNMVTGHSLVDM